MAKEYFDNPDICLGVETAATSRYSQQFTPPMTRRSVYNIYLLYLRIITVVPDVDQ